MMAPKEVDIQTVLTILDSDAGSSNAAGLAYALGVTYERSGNRVAALNIYLRYPEEPAIHKRLLR